MNRGYASLKSQGLKEERILLLETWRELEVRTVSDVRDVVNVDNKFPRKIKMRRPVTRSNDNTDQESPDEVEFEEYYEYQFPDDATKIAGLKLLENAMKWKKSSSAAITQPADDLTGVLGTSSGKRKHVDDDGDVDFNISKKPTIEPSPTFAADTNEIDIDG